MSSKGGVIRRELDPDRGEATVQIAEAVADLEEIDVQQLPCMWGCIGHALDHVFSSPPSPEAETEVSFSYEGYRITVDQRGRATFERLD